MTKPKQESEQLFDMPPSEAPKPRRPRKAKPAPAAEAPVDQSKVVAIRPREPRSMLSVIAAAAADPNCDVTKMKALLDMQRDLEHEQARRDFIRAFIDLAIALPVIRADGKIEIREKDERGQRSGRIQQTTMYATHKNIMRAIKPLLHKHGFGLSFSTEPTPDGTRILVRGYLDHEGGYQRETAFPLPAETSGSKNNVQGWGSAQSYGKRYCTIALLNIISEATQDADLDGATIVKGSPQAIDGEVIPGPPTITQEQQDQLVDSIEACGVGRKTFLKHYGIERLADLPADRFAEAMRACADYGAKHRGKA